MTEYLDRDEWTDVPASGDELTGGLLVGPAFHWPGTKQDEIGDPGLAGIATRIEHYRNFHVNGRGWRDLGYNEVIDQAGRVWMGRSTEFYGNMVGAHCASPANRNANRKYVGVLLLLGRDEQPSTKMITASQHWYHDVFLRYWPGRDDVRDHSGVFGASTACAGPYVRAMLDELTAKPDDGGDGLDGDGWDGHSFPGRNAFRIGRRHKAVTVLDKRLIVHGFDRYHDGDGYQPGPTFTTYTRRNVAAFQRAQGWTGSDADGQPGPVTWRRLMAKPPPDLPTVDLSKLREAARVDPPRASHLARYPSGTRLIERALVAEDMLDPRWADKVGHFGSKTVEAYSRWQRSKAGGNYRGSDADGIPGRDSLERLGRRHGFDVRA